MRVRVAWWFLLWGTGSVWISMSVDRGKISRDLRKRKTCCTNGIPVELQSACGGSRCSRISEEKRACKREATCQVEVMREGGNAMPHGDSGERVCHVLRGFETRTPCECCEAPRMEILSREIKRRWAQLRFDGRRRFG